MRPSPDTTATIPSPTTGGARTSLLTRLVHNGLPLASYASTSPLSVPTTTRLPPAPTRAARRLPVSARHAVRPLFASGLMRSASDLATYTASPASVGASPGAALPIDACQSTRALAVGWISGSGPGLFDLPKMPNVGIEIDGSIELIVPQPPRSRAAATAAGQHRASGATRNARANVIWRAG